MYALRAGQNSRKFRASRSVEQSFSTTRVLGARRHQTCAAEISARPYTYTETSRRGRILLFRADVSYFAVYYGSAPRARNAARVKRRLLRSIFARCTSPNANRELARALGILSRVSLFFMSLVFLYPSYTFSCLGI